MRLRSPNKVVKFNHQLPLAALDGVECTVPTLCSDAEHLLLHKDIDRAQYEADRYNCTIQMSSVGGGGLGYYTTVAVKKGALLGYYWGPWKFDKTTPSEADNSRLMNMLKFVVTEEGERFYVYNTGSTRCATSYSNCPAGLSVVPNASFEEHELNNDDSVASLDPHPCNMVGLYALCDLKAGAEIFSDYGAHYGDISAHVAEEGDESDSAMSVATPAATQKRQSTGCKSVTPRQKRRRQL
jgi:hypothetical protein